MTPSQDGWPTKTKEAPSPHEVRLYLLDTNPVFQCLRDKFLDLVPTLTLKFLRSQGLHMTGTLDTVSTTG